MQRHHTKMLLTLAMSLAVLTLTALPVSALDPLCPPEEGFVITSDANMEVIGRCELKQDYTHEVC